LPASLDLLRERRFLVYWLAGLSANVGWQFQLVGASWLMTSLARTPELVALVQTSVALPVMLLSLPGGAISDTIGQRTLVICAQAFLLVFSICLAIFAYLDLLTPTLLLLFTFLIGSARALYYPGWQATVFDFLPRNQIATAVALNASNLNVARSLGPSLGGAIVATAGAFMAFLVAALSNLSVMLVAHRWPKPAALSDLPPEPFAIAVVAGIRYVALSPSLLIIMLRSFVFNIGAISIIALLPLVAQSVLEGGPVTYGLLLGAFGAGAVAGALTIDEARRLVPTEPFLALGFLGFAAACLLLTGLQTLTGALIASALGGVAWVYVQVTLYSTVQLSSPRWVLSRCIAIYQTFVFGGNALGSLIWGMLAGWQGTPLSLAVAAAFMVAGSILGVFFKVVSPADDSTAPALQWVAPSPAVNLTNESGPILTTIRWRVRAEDVPGFLEAMREKRRVRKRDGAANWTLSRDIQDRFLWYERFEVATWASAIRLHSRRTVASGEAFEKVKRFHIGSEPEVHYELVRQPSARMHASTDGGPHMEL
jgi:MFS family permease